MRKVKYVGQLDGVILMLDGNPTVVNNGDVVSVPDDFFNANFVDYVEPSTAATTMTKTSK